MKVYFIFLIILVGINLLFKKSKKTCCILSCLFLIFFTYIKLPTLGNSDTLGIYLPRFKLIQSLSIASTAKFIGKIEAQFAFYILTKVFTLFSGNYSLYVTLCSTLLLIMFSRIVYKYSKSPTFSYIIFFSIFYPWTWIILKHSFAWGFLLLAYEALIRGKNKRFIIFVIIASLFHISALLFLLALPVSKMKIGKYQYVVLAIVFVVTQLFYKNISQIIFSVITTGHYTMYEGKSTSFGIMGMLLYVCIFIAISMLTSKETKNEYVFKINYNMIWLGTIFVFMANVVWDIFRISMFYNIIICIVLPNTIYNLKNKKTKDSIYIILAILFSIYGINTFTTLNLFPIIFGTI